MIGSKVTLKKSTAKWYLDNPDIFFSLNGKESEGFNEQIQQCMLTILGEDIIGVVTGRGNGDNVFRVRFTSVFGSTHSYYDYPTQIKTVK